MMWVWILGDLLIRRVQDELDSICTENDKDDLFIEWGKEAMIKGSLMCWCTRMRRVKLNL